MLQKNNHCHGLYKLQRDLYSWFIQQYLPCTNQNQVFKKVYVYLVNVTVDPTEQKSPSSSVRSRFSSSWTTLLWKWSLDGKYNCHFFYKQKPSLKIHPHSRTRNTHYRSKELLSVTFMSFLWAQNSEIATCRLYKYLKQELPYF